MPDAHDPYQALRHREYRWFLLGNLALTMATQIQTRVMGWQAYEMTKDPLSIGLVGLSEAVPFLLLTLYGGVVSDRVERRKICMAGQGVLVLGAVVLFLVNLGALKRVEWLYGVQILGGLARAFYRPAYQALATELVPREAYANASTWRSGMFHVAMVAGPGVGALLLLSGYRLAYGMELALMLAGCLYFLVLKPRPLPPPKPGSAFTQLGEGVRFVFRQKVVLAALSLDLFAVLFGAATALLPVFAEDILKVGKVGFALLGAASGLGSILMSLALAHRPAPRKAGRTLLACVAAFGLCWIAFAYSRSLWLSVVLLFMSGAFDNVSVVMRATLIQNFTPSELMGRVSAVNSFFIGSSNELGSFESGLAAKILGVVPSVLFGGAMTLVTVALTAWRAPQLRKLDRLDETTR